MYSRTVRAPTSVESRLLEMAIHIAGIAIARRRAEERIQFMATHDELTGLPNRARFGEQLADALQGAAQRGAWLCVAYIDFDNFKFVNDSLGHSAGDALLKIMAERMVAAVGPNDIVSRLGGDEFVVLLIDPPKDTASIGAMLHRIRSAVVAPVELDGRSFRVTSSFGAAVYPSGRRDRRDPARQRRRRDVQRQGIGRRRSGVLRAGDQRQSARTPDAARRIAQRRSEPRFRPALSAASRSAKRRRVRGRSADPLAPPAASAWRRRRNSSRSPRNRGSSSRSATGRCAKPAGRTRRGRTPACRRSPSASTSRRVSSAKTTSSPPSPWRSPRAGSSRNISSWN